MVLDWLEGEKDEDEKKDLVPSCCLTVTGRLATDTITCCAPRPKGPQREGNSLWSSSPWPSVDLTGLHPRRYILTVLL